MVQMQEGDDLGAIERVFVEADPKLARKAALSFYSMYGEVLQQTEEFNKRIELEEYVRSLHGHPTSDVLASRAWPAECSDSEVGCVDTDEEDSMKTESMVVMVVDGALTDSGKEEEFLIKGASWTIEEEAEAGGITKIEHDFYAKAGKSVKEGVGRDSLTINKIFIQ